MAPVCWDHQMMSPRSRGRRPALAGFAMRAVVFPRGLLAEGDCDA